RSAKKYSPRLSRKCRPCRTRRSMALKQRCGRRCRCRTRCPSTRFYQSWHYPRPKFIVRCLHWRPPSTYGNCLERNTFGVFEKTACCFFCAQHLLDRRKASNKKSGENGWKKIIGDC